MSQNTTWWPPMTFLIFFVYIKYQLGKRYQKEEVCGVQQESEVMRRTCYWVVWQYKESKWLNKSSSLGGFRANESKCKMSNQERTWRKTWPWMCICAHGDVILIWRVTAVKTPVNVSGPVTQTHPLPQVEKGICYLNCLWWHDLSPYAKAWHYNTQKANFLNTGLPQTASV